MARKKVNSAAAGRSTRIAIAATIVPPDRDTPGISASAWKQPIATARPSGISSTVNTSGTGRSRSTISMTIPPTMNEIAMMMMLP